jgi:MYXO-CTERM domain-containing protein
VGNVNTGQGPVCFEPVQGNFFAALCAMSPGANDSGMALGFGVAALLLARRRRSRA